MADDPKAAPVTDSRQAGFNPEVEASHAETAAAAANAVPQTASGNDAAAATQKPRTGRTVLTEILTALNDRLGNHPKIVALIKELEAL